MPIKDVKTLIRACRFVLDKIPEVEFLLSPRTTFNATYTYAELLTEVAMDKIQEIKKAMESGENPMQFKKIMAFEIVKIIKSEKEAKEAEEFFTTVNACAVWGKLKGPAREYWRRALEEPVFQTLQ